MAHEESVTYEELPALCIRRKELRASLRVVTAGGMLCTVWLVVVGGTTISNLGYLAGFSDMHWGMLTSVGFAATLAQLPGSYHIERTGRRKRLFLVGGVTGRLLWIVVGLLPALLLLSDTSASRAVVTWLALTVMLLAYALGQVAAPSWMTWMADLIPSRIRGRFFARRNVYCLSVQVVSAIAVGLLLDAVIGPEMRERLQDPLKRMDMRADDVRALVWTLTGVFALAAVVGAGDILLFRRVREILPRAPRERIAPLEIVLGPLRNAPLRRYVMGLSLVTFGVAIMAPFVLLLLQRHLHFSNYQSMMMLMLWGPLGNLMSSQAWGRAVDRWGCRAILTISTIGMGLHIWMWLLIPPGSMLMAGLVGFMGGVTWCGHAIARTNMDFAFADRTARSTFGVSTSIMLAAAGVAGGAAGGLVCKATDGMSVVVGPLEMVNYHVVILISGAVRLLSLVWLAGARQPGDKPVAVVARQMAHDLLQTAPTVLTQPLRMIRWPIRMWGLSTVSVRRAPAIVPVPDPGAPVRGPMPPALPARAGASESPAATQAVPPDVAPPQNTPPKVVPPPVPGPTQTTDGPGGPLAA